MKKSRVLRAAVRKHLRREFTVRKHLRREFTVVEYRAAADSYLCNALNLYGNANPEHRAVVDAIRRDILRALGSSYTIQDWLRRALKLPIDHEFDPDELYAYRKRWAEHMAEQYESRGD